MGDRRLRTAVVLDPYPLWLDAVQRLLENSDVAVVGATRSVGEAVELVADQQPDLFIAEILHDDASEDDVFATLRDVHSRSPDVRIIVFSSSDAPENVKRALAGGALAYVVKTALPEDVAFAVRHALSPSMYLAGTNADPPGAHASQDVARLTKRELEILRLVAEGNSNSELARKLWVTEQTVKFHLSNIYRKLNVANRTEASRWAHRRGLLPEARGG